ncbi:hypothetical protein BC937DRAFT_91986 [Endogone sp. FLAS-F59071]|nr:hypothetical protein BC937DRAFT_91986 [Endogone sp. FLAS-F59071]|eukprot:RUS15796.1 hypothetical protein BC937DRAFT_91986 [Endogone sp. FLAS-F59071]
MACGQCRQHVVLPSRIVLSSARHFAFCVAFRDANIKDNDGQTPLDLAEEKQVEIVSYLKAEFGDVDANEQAKDYELCFCFSSVFHDN